MSTRSTLAVSWVALFLFLWMPASGQTAGGGSSGGKWYLNNAEFTLRDSIGTVVTVRIRLGWNAHYGATTEMGFVHQRCKIKVHALSDIHIQLLKRGNAIAGRTSNYRQMLEDHEHHVLWWRVADDFFGNHRFNITDDYTGVITIDSRWFPMPMDLMKALYSLPEPEPVEE